MSKFFDAARLWGTDHWAKENKPEWAHSSGVEDWHTHLATLNALGYDGHGAAIMPFPSTRDGGFLGANREVSRAAARDSRLSPVYAVQPNRGARAVDELAASDEFASCSAIKLWPYLGRFNLDDLLENQQLVDYLRKGNKSILMHVGNGRERATRPAFPDVRATPDVALRCARELGDIPVVIAHVARLCPQTLQGVRDTPNAYIDLSGLTSVGKWRENGEDGLPVATGQLLAALGPVGILRRLIFEYGLEDKLLFGTTWPFSLWWGVDLTDDVQLIEKSALGDTIKDKLLWRNAAAFGLPGGETP